MKNNGSHLLTAGIVWVVLTVIGEALAFLDLYPTVASEWAEESDWVFQFLLILGIPVFTFVVATLTYAVLRFSTDDIDATGPTVRGTGLVPKVWVLITGGLAVFVMIFPGLVGVAELREVGGDYGFGDKVEEDPIVINVTGFRWAWAIEYPEEGITLNSNTDTLVLQKDRQVVFNINSSDVVHSFWIPAFRMKIDAIPGRTTQLALTPTETGSFDGDAAFRVQCAELCGRDHGLMRMDVAVVEEAEFDAWLAEQGGQ